MTSNASSPNRWPLVVLLLMAVGVPTAAGMTFAAQVTENPWRALGLALIYELLVLIFGFIFKVWQKLESRWVDRAADWVDRKVQSVFSRYHRRYLEHLVYRHRAFDVKGLTTQGIYTLELERVFVELSVVPKALHHVSADPIRRVPEELRGGRHVIWDYLQAEQMGNQNLAVIGPPGCGKTTLLKHMTLTLAVNGKHRRKSNAPDKLPILLYLRNHAQDIQVNPDLTLVQAVQNTLAKWNVQAPPGWFESQLEKGCCLVMFDGLDEVADPKARRQVVNWVERQMEAYGRNRFVTTSRPHGYRTNPLIGVTVLEVRTFTGDQVRRFVHNWYLANEMMSAQKDDPGVRMAAKEGAEDLLRRIRSTPALSDMAVNPLLLTMIATVHRYRSALPRRRVELYTEICDVFLGTRQQARGLALDLTPAQKRFVLQPLAYHMMCQEQREIPLADAVKVIAEPLVRVTRQVSEKDFLKNIENTSGLLLERENGVYSFAHLTFQEYLAAAYVQESRLESELVGRVEDSWWHETIRLYIAQADATSILAACLASDPPPVPALILAVECLEEARDVRPDMRERLKTVLDQGVEDPDEERRRIVAEVLLGLRLRRMVRMGEDKYVDNTLITHAEYQLFLDEQRALDKYHQPDHWLDYQFSAGQGRSPAVGVRPSDAVAFCEWLTVREPGEWCYRLPIAGELDTLPLDYKDQRSPTTGLGCWEVSDEGAECVRIGKSEPIITYEMLMQRFASDRASKLASASASKLTNTLADARIRTRACDLYRDLDLDRVHALASDLDHVRGPVSGEDLTLIRARASARALADAFPRAVDRASQFTSARAVDRARALARAVDRASQLTSASDRASQLTSAVDFDLALDLARALADDLDRTRKLASASELTSDIDRARALAGTLDLVCARAVKDFLGEIDFPDAISRARKFASASAVDLDLDLVLDFDLALASASALACELASASAHDRVRTLDRTYDLDRAHDFARDLAHDLALASASDLDRASASDLDRAHDRALALVGALALALAHALAFAHDRALDRALDLVFGRASDLTRIYTRRPAMEFFSLRWYIRHCTLAVATELLSLIRWPKQSWTRPLSLSRGLSAKEEAIQRLATDYLSVYVALAVLEERIQGNLPAFEGIRIVKERKREETEQGT